MAKTKPRPKVKRKPKKILRAIERAFEVVASSPIDGKAFEVYTCCELARFYNDELSWFYKTFFVGQDYFTRMVYFKTDFFERKALRLMLLATFHELCNEPDLLLPDVEVNGLLG